MSAAVITAIGGIITAAGGVVSNILDYYGSEAANKDLARRENQSIAAADQARDDSLRQTNVSNRYNQQTLDLSKDRFIFDKAINRKGLELDEKKRLGEVIGNVAQTNASFRNWLSNTRRS